jgi:hypothetical protein
MQHDFKKFSILHADSGCRQYGFSEKLYGMEEKKDESYCRLYGMGRGMVY